MSQPPKKKPAAPKAEGAAGSRSATPPVSRPAAPGDKGTKSSAPALPPDPPAAAEEYGLQATEPPVIETPPPRPRPAPVPTPAAPAVPAAAPRANPAVLAFAGGIAAAGLLGAVVWVIFGRGGESGAPREPQQTAAPQVADSTPPQDDDSRQAGETDDEKIASAENSNDPPAVATTETPRPEPAPEQTAGTEPTPPAATGPRVIDVRRALYTVLARNAEKTRYFRLGTAWAIAPRCLVTSGAVIMAVEELQQADLKVIVSPAGAMQEVRVVGIRVHPHYRQGLKDAVLARKEIDNPPRRPAGQPPIVPGAPPAFPPLPSPREKLAVAQWMQLDFDLGVLELMEPRDYFLPSPVAPIPVSPEERLVVTGLPFKVDEFLPGDVAKASEMEESAGNEVAEPAGRPPQFARILNFAGNFDGRNWAGSPVSIRGSLVVGVYSREVPGVEGENSGRSAHSAAQIHHLRDFASDLLK